MVNREGKEITLRLDPAERGELYAKQHEIKQWGLTVRDFFPAPQLGENETPNLDGVLVTSVRPGRTGRRSRRPFPARHTLREVNGARR